MIQKEYFKLFDVINEKFTPNVAQSLLYINILLHLIYIKTASIHNEHIINVESLNDMRYKQSLKIPFHISHLKLKFSRYHQFTYAPRDTFVLLLDIDKYIFYIYLNITSNKHRRFLTRNNSGTT